MQINNILFIILGVIIIFCLFNNFIKSKEGLSVEKVIPAPSRGKCPTIKEVVSTPFKERWWKWDVKTAIDNGGTYTPSPYGSCDLRHSSSDGSPTTSNCSSSNDPNCAPDFVVPKPGNTLIYKHTYTHFNNDCPDNEIEFQTKENVSQKQCESLCNEHNECKGYSYDVDANPFDQNCILKSKYCNRDCEANQGKWSFYKKNLGEITDPSDRCPGEPTYNIFNHDCSLMANGIDNGLLNPDISLSNTSLSNCKEECNLDKDCKGITYGWETAKGITCILKNNNCSTPGVKTSNNKLKFAEKISPTPDLSGSWYSLDLISGPLFLKQDKLKVSGDYSTTLSLDIDKPEQINRESGEGIITSDNKKIVWQWKNPPNSKPMVGTFDYKDGKVTEIQWKNKFNSKWTREIQSDPKFPFPEGYIENTGTCGYSQKNWDNLLNSFYFKHLSPNENIGIKTNQECAAACTNDDECYAFQNINNKQPSPCVLFYEEIKDFDKNGNLGTLDKNQASCYVKSTPPKLPPPKIPLPKGYEAANGCCGSPVNPNKPNTAQDLSHSLKTYNSKTVAECSDYCNSNPECFAFSVNRTKQPSTCILWPKYFAAKNGKLDNEDGKCLTENSCYTKVTTKRIGEPTKSRILYNNPLPLQNVTPIKSSQPNPFLALPQQNINPTMPGSKPGDLKPLNILPPNNPATMDNKATFDNPKTIDNTSKENFSNIGGFKNKYLSIIDSFNFESPLPQTFDNSTVSSYTPKYLNDLGGNNDNDNYCINGKLTKVNNNILDKIVVPNLL